MEYILGRKEDFWKFVDSIKKDDKIGIVSHNDLDGVASVVFLEKILNFKKINVSSINYFNLDFIKFENITAGMNVNKLFITDINVEQYPDVFEKVRRKYAVFVIDHHSVNPNLKDKSNILKTDVVDCSTSIVYDLAKEVMDISSFNWLVCAAMISDWSFKKQENAEFIKSFYPKFSPSSFIESEIGEITDSFVKAVIYFRDDLRKIYPLVKNKKIDEIKKYSVFVDKEIEKSMVTFEKNSEYFPEKNLYFWYFNPKFKILSYLSSLISNKHPDDTLIIVSNVPGNKDFVKLSARNQNRRVDMVNLLKNSLEGFENAKSGGHIPAAGGTFMKKDMAKFREKLLKFIK